MMPALLTLTRPPLGIWVWLTCGGGSVVAGWFESSERNGRVCAVAPDRWAPARWSSWRGPATLRVTGWPTRRTEGQWRVPAVIVGLGSEVGDRRGLRPLAGQGVMLAGSGLDIGLGSLVSGDLTLRVPPVAAVPGGFDYREFLAGRGLRWRGWLEKPAPGEPGLTRPAHFGQVLGAVRDELTGRLRRALPGPEAAIMEAVLLGSRTDASRSAGRPFADLGMAHLFAVSGLHVGILVAMVLVPVRMTGTPQLVASACVLVFLSMYVTLTGMPGSVIRAAGLTALALGASRLGRRCDPLHLLGFLFWATTVWEPRQVLDTGVRLSYLAAGGILTIQPALATGGALRRPGVPGKLVTALSISLAAQWFTLPQVATSFGKISALSPAANLLGVPVFGGSVWLVVMGLVAEPFLPWLAEALSAVGWLTLRALSAIAGLVGTATGGMLVGLPVPGLAKVSAFLMLSVGVLVLLERAGRSVSPKPALLVGALVLLLAGTGLVMPAGKRMHRAHEVQVWQFDVGQGDSCLLVFPDGWRAVIDTGGRFQSGSWLERNLLGFLTRHGVGNLDAVLLTHGHRDHTGGSLELLDRIDVKHWYVGGTAGRMLTGKVAAAKVVTPVAGQVIHHWRDWRLVCYYPLPAPSAQPSSSHTTVSSREMPAADELSENDRSLVVGLVRGNDPLMLWTGDLEAAGEGQLLAAGDLPTGFQVLKAGHHGSDTSSSPAFLEWVSPRHVLISCGVENQYQHPSHGPYVVAGDTLAASRTDLDGTLHLRFDASGAVFLDGRGVRPAAKLDSLEKRP